MDFVPETVNGNGRKIWFIAAATQPTHAMGVETS
jgi:hypothetical protein